LDLETTGLDPEQDGICSVGAAHAAKGEFYMECRPQYVRDPHPRALEVNGFTMADFRDPRKPLERGALVALKTWLTEPDAYGNTYGKYRVVGKNPGFDVGFLRRRDCVELPFHGRVVDVHSEAYLMACADGECVENPEYSIYEYYKKLGIPDEPEVHNALEGARHAMRIHCLLADRLAALQLKAGQLEGMLSKPATCSGRED